MCHPVTYFILKHNIIWKLHQMYYIHNNVFQLALLTRSLALRDTLSHQGETNSYSQLRMRLNMYWSPLSSKKGSKPHNLITEKTNKTVVSNKVTHPCSTITALLVFMVLDVFFHMYHILMFIFKNVKTLIQNFKFQS